LRLFISCGNKKNNEWENLKEMELQPYSEIYREQSVMIPVITTMIDCFGINNEEIVLPNREKINVTLTYTQFDRGVSFLITQGKKTLLNFGGFKRSETDYDPSVVFLTPGGIHVSLMVGPPAGK